MEHDGGGLIDFSKIKQRKVRDLLMKNGLYSLRDLSGLKSFCYDKADGKRYHQHIKSFSINAPIDSVWNVYKTISPEETWKGNMVSFGVMYSRKKNSLTFPGETYSGLETGQILFMNLNLFSNLLHLAVGHEITGVNDQEKWIKICYLQNGASVGTQKIQLVAMNDVQTNIIHETWYRSGSYFRDKVLYPSFHGRAISEFHHNVKLKAELIGNR
jgi:hypothetical protein